MTCDDERLNDDEVMALLRLNRRLTSLEKRTREKIVPYRERLFRELEDPDDWLTDFEFDAVFDFYLDESDPSWDEDAEDENILATARLFLKHDGGLYVGDDNDHADSVIDARLRAERHCLLFHHLYDHTSLTWKDLLRIGSVWVDLQPILQREEPLPSPTRAHA